jgi:hypothetical protein
MNSIGWLMSETKIVLVCVPAIAIVYAVMVVCKRRAFDLNELTLVVVDVVGVIGGVAMLVRAFKMPDTLSEQAKWTGIAGTCTALLFFFQAVSVFKKVLVSQDAPSPAEKKAPESADS